MAARRIVENSEHLTNHGLKETRLAVLDILEYGLSAVSGFETVKHSVRLVDRTTLVVGGRRYILPDMGKVYVIGAGKAVLPMAKGLDKVLGKRIDDGLVIAKAGQTAKLSYIETRTAAHPVPDARGFRATEELKQVAMQAGKDDIVLCLISGGASALMPSPEEGITLSDEIETNKLLLDSGMRIEQMNVIRNHISTLKGGKLAALLKPAKVIGLIISDEPHGSVWGPTVPDRNSFEDACNYAKAAGIWRKLPSSVRIHLLKGKEGKREGDFRCAGGSRRLPDAFNLLLANNEMACRAAFFRGKELGMKPLILTTRLTGESSQAGRILAAMATDSRVKSSLSGRYNLLVAGGETTVRLEGRRGKGGPSQEFALGALSVLEPSDKVVACAMDTDGTDGPTSFAGGLIDSESLSTLADGKIRLASALQRHDSSRLLQEMGDAIIANDTGTNVMDINLIAIE